LWHPWTKGTRHTGIVSPKGIVSPNRIAAKTSIAIRRILNFRSTSEGPRMALLHARLECERLSAYASCRDAERDARANHSIV